MLGLGVSHHWITEDMLGIPYERPVQTMRCYLDVLDQALRGPGPVEVENEQFRIHNPLDVTDISPTPVLLAALGPAMLRLAGERADGTSLWMAEERAIESHVAPLISRAAQMAGRPAPRILAGLPICLCRDDDVEAATEQTDRSLSEAEISPNYQKVLEHGEARGIGDILCAGSEARIEKRLRAFTDAGATDVSARVVPLGRNREERSTSAQRTREFLASLTL